MKQIGVTGTLLNLLESYLSNRKQRVVIDGIYSDQVSVTSGIPQGSRLGPLLFIIYINDILNELECEGLLFADDTSLTTWGEDANITTAAISRDLQKILEWSKIWKVTFNESKTKDMIFTNKVMNNSPPIMFNNTLVDKVVSHKHLEI